MPFGLGFFATAGAGGAAGSFDLLETQVLGSSAASVTFSSLSTYASTYKHLQIRYTARSSRVNTLDYPFFRVNADSGANYSWHNLTGNGSSVSSGSGSSQTFMYLPYSPAANSTANNFNAGVIDLLDPFETTKAKTFRTLGGSTGENYIHVFSGRWGSTSAVSSVTLHMENGNYVTGSRFSLYGVKGS